MKRIPSIFTVEVEGAAEIRSRQLFDGHALLCLRSGTQPGKVSILVRSDLFGEVSGEMDIPV